MTKLDVTADKIKPTGSFPKFWILIIFLIAGGVFINWSEQRGEAAVERQNLSRLPEKLGEWRQKGEETRFEQQTEAVLRTTDYTMRDYVLPSGRTANLYVGYYASQRTGATYHSPQNCLPGAGWVLQEPEIIEINTAHGKSFAANRFLIVNGNYRAILVYWYQGRGRVVASEYTDKVYTVLDSVLRRRSDGAMVRVMTSVGASEEEGKEATKAAVDLAAQTADNLSDFVPE